MPSSTVEDYLKHIYLQQRPAGPGAATGSGLVPMGKLAAGMGVVPGTATAMVKTLADSGLVLYEPREGVRLTREGAQLALHVLRRHRLIELFLVKVLGLDWSEVHPEAEELEHVVSDKVLERMDILLGRPSVDPHGDPIPTPRGKVAEPRQSSLIECPVGQPLRIARIADQDPAFLQYLTRCGLTPGVAVSVVERDSVADAVVLRAGKAAPLTLGSAAAAKIWVEGA